MSASQDQTHPLDKRDRAVVDRLLSSSAEPTNLAELARLRIRYRNFPGARDIQRDLEVVLQQWNLTEEDLFAQTRQLHAKKQVYQRQQNDDRQDWS